jgi:hypothetical protein
MNTTLRHRHFIALLVVFEILFFWAVRAEAHCDTLGGPVVQTAQMALETGDVTPVLKWVPISDENAIREAFQNTLVVRQLGQEARKLADGYFFETLVRIHRAGEGAPYTGLKHGVDADPAVTLADRAVESGSAEKLSGALTAAIDKGINDRFRRVIETSKHANESIGAGRQYVAAYVDFTHYAESVHNLVEKTAEHHAHP